MKKVLLTAATLMSGMFILGQTPSVSLDFSYGGQVSKVSGIEGELMGTPQTTSDRMGNTVQAMEWSGTGTSYYVVDSTQGTTMNMGTVDGLTLSAWVNADLGAIGSDVAVITKWNVFNQNASHFGLYLNPQGYLTFKHNPLTVLGVNTNGITTTVQSNTWTHVAVTLDYQTSSISFYIDGALVKSVAVGSSPMPTLNDTKLSIGAEHNDEDGVGANPSNFFEGSIDDVLMYSEAVSATIIDSIYNATPHYCEGFEVNVSNIVGSYGTNGSFDFEIVGGEGPYTYELGTSAPIQVNSGLMSIQKFEGLKDTLFAPNSTSFVSLNFSSYGSATVPNGDEVEYGSCHSAQSYTVMEPAIYGHDTIVVWGNNGFFGDPCFGFSKKLTLIVSYAGMTTVSNLSAGQETLKVTDANGCEVSTMVTIPASFASVDEIKHDFKVYPNPVKDQLTISLSESTTGSIRILNTAGQVVEQFQIVDAMKVMHQMDLPNGVYVMALTTEDNKSNFSKIVIRK